MLEKLFKDPKAAMRWRGGRLGSLFESFIHDLSDLGYTPVTLRAKLLLVGELAVWLRKRKLQVSEIEEERVDKFLASLQRKGRLRRGDALTAHQFLGHLRLKGVTRAPKTRIDRSPLGRLRRRYEKHLRNERGLPPETGRRYWGYLGPFLDERFGDRPIQLRKLTPDDVSNFLLRYAHSSSPGAAKLMVSALRSFFRFLFQVGETKTNLAGAVPTVPSWRLAHLPKFLKTEEVERVIHACDRRTSIGRRDHAVLLLLARLGLRAGEVLRLELDDIDWRAGELTVRGKGGFHDRLPLPSDVGKAMAVYLRRGRSPCTTRRVFIRSRAPYRGLGHASTVCTIVRYALNRAGLDPAHKGAHLLRHSLATGMIRRGATMTEIGEILRHRTPNTTEIYAKVDIEGLRTLAQRWPTRGGAR